MNNASFHRLIALELAIRGEPRERVILHLNTYRWYKRIERF